MHGVPCNESECTGYRAVKTNAREAVLEREDVLSELEPKLNALGAQIEETWRGL